MGFESGFDEKIDVIDLIINVLKDHEKKMDELVTRLEETQVFKIPPSVIQSESARPERRPSRASVTATLRKWSEFREKSNQADIVAFDIEGGWLRICALSDGILYRYDEEIPEMEIKYRTLDDKSHIDSVDIGSALMVPSAIRGRMDCGIELDKEDVEVKLPGGEVVHKIIYRVDAGAVKSWLAYRLEVDDDAIIQGEIKLSQ